MNLKNEIAMFNEAKKTPQGKADFLAFKIFLIAILIIPVFNSCTKPEKLKLPEENSIFRLDVKADMQGWETYNLDENGNVLFVFGDVLRDNIANDKIYAKKWLIPILRGNYNEYQHYWMNFAWDKWHDKEFMLMLSAENGLFNADRKGDNGWSTGFCQIHKAFHPEIVENPKFKDPAWQLEQCYNLFTSGTKFYGYERIKKNPSFRKQQEAKFNF